MYCRLALTDLISILRYLTGLVVMCHRDDFPFGVSFFKIPGRFRNLTQRVTSIYHRHNFAGFNKLFHSNQIFLVWFRQYVAHFLTPGR